MRKRSGWCWTVWTRGPAGISARETGHGRAETRTLKTAHVSHLDLPHARQAIKLTRWRQDTATGKTSRQTVYAVTSLTSADATAQDLARLVREHWSIEVVVGSRTTLFRPGMRTDLRLVSVAERRNGVVTLSYANA
jgi:hypothetical protein